MAITSAGLLMYRIEQGQLEVFLVHPGGPFFKNKEQGYWTIPKGLPEENETLLEAAQREFEEETGLKTEGPFIDLGNVKQKGGKIVYAWAFQSKNKIQDILPSNTFALEWPPKSGVYKNFPEIDKVAFYNLEEAMVKINEAQCTFIIRLKNKLFNES